MNGRHGHFQVKQIEAYRHRIGVADYCGCLDEGVNLLVPGISASLRRPAHRVHQRPLPKAIPTENDAPEGQTDGLMTVSPAGTPRHNNSPKNKGQVAAALHRDSENKSISSEDGSLRQVQALGCTEERLQDWQPPCCTTLAISAEQCIKIGHAGQSREGCQAALKSPPLATAPSANQVLPGQVTDAQAGASVQALCAKSEYTVLSHQNDVLLGFMRTGISSDVIRFYGLTVHALAVFVQGAMERRTFHPRLVGQES